jgi:Iron-containing redox enzyme
VQAADFLRSQIARLDSWCCELPDSAQDLEAWMHACAQTATAKYTAYLEERKAGAPRRFFSNRAHALYFLRAVAPTKLVDGAWLYGLIAHWENPRFANLIRTYVEELGEGAADKNHVVLYRRLMACHGLDTADDLDDSFYTQGLIQLALAFNAEEFLPELIGFNLGYEQLPLHLLITAYELNELGLDPYYFTLHVTVDNTDTGHARRAVQAVMDNLPRLGNPDDFWRRVRLGFQLSDAGAGTTEVIADFDIEQEVVRILARKSAAGHGAHSDYCRVGGRTVNDWLARPDDVPAFLTALQGAGWIKLGAPVEQSRFWSLLQGDRAEMFGVFNDYELQMIHDWIRGSASADGRAYNEHTEPLAAPRGAGSGQPSFRAKARLAAARGQAPLVNAFDHEMLDSDLQSLTQQLAVRDEAGQAALLIEAMAPSSHWTSAGLHATRVFCARSR